MSELFSSRKLRIEEMASCEKLWLLAEEMFRDKGVENVSASQIAGLFGQALACAVIYNSKAPLDRETLHTIMTHAEKAAVDAHGLFLDHLRRSKAKTG